MATKKTKKKTTAKAHVDPPAATPRPAPTITSVANAANHSTKVDLQTGWAALVAGILAHYAPTDTFLVPDGTLTRDLVVQKLHKFIAAAEATKDRKKEYLAAVQAERHVLAELRPTHDSIVSIVRGRYGKSSQLLLQYGITPAKTRKKTVATKSAAVEKSLATRAARGTKGRRQRSAIRGMVATPVTTTPSADATQPSGIVAGVAAPAATAPQPAAAPAPPEATGASNPRRTGGST